MVGLEWIVASLFDNLAIKDTKRTRVRLHHVHVNNVGLYKGARSDIRLVVE